ncbi:hypothetical protein UlMin_020116 [Ulmus minor]
MGDVVRMDWRQKLPMPTVKSQGNWNTCWAFTTVESIELRHRIITGEHIELSAQHLIDFAWPKGKVGFGYKPKHAFEYIKQNGVTTEDIYPYLGGRKENIDPTIKFENYYKIENYGLVSDVKDISRILKDRPLIIGGSFDISLRIIKDWTIYIPDHEASDFRLHTLLLVGEGSDVKDGERVEYWIIKNSWGPKWGIGGYGRIIKKQHILCLTAWYPLLVGDTVPPRS